MGAASLVGYRTRMPIAVALLLLSFHARAADGWSGEQTTTPVDVPADEAPANDDTSASESDPLSPARPEPQPPDADPEETAARWGLTGTTSPETQAAAGAASTDTSAWGVAPVVTEDAPPPEPAPAVPVGPVNRATDYTAYALELGEVRLGLAEMGVGIAPRVQLTTTPVLYALGVWNGEVKGNVLRAGAWDMSLVGGVNGLTEGRDFQAFWTRVGMVHSFRAGKRVGLHLGGGWDHIFALGLPGPSTLDGLIWNDQQQRRHDRWYDTVSASEDRFEASQDLLSLRTALDVEITPRDAIVFQASGFVLSDARSNVTAGGDAEVFDLPPVLGLDEIFSDAPDPGTALAQSWVAGLAYQATYRHLQVRVGGGWSAQTWAWVPATFDASWRFGGPSRRTTRPGITENPTPG